MRTSNASPIRPNQSDWFSALLWLCLSTISLHASAQQQSSSGAVEIFDPVFDVGIEQRPRAGLYGITELMMAALEADIPTAKRLIEAGADVNETDDSQSTPLMWAVHSGEVNIVNFLIAEGADVDARAYQGATALINAISGKQAASAIALINAGADPNGRGNSSRNFLETAAESGMTDVVEALINNGVDIASSGSSALSYAVRRGQTDTVLLLLNAGVDANATAARSQNTILYDAAASGNVDIVELLISNGADAIQASDSRSPLHAAVSGGHTGITDILIASGAVATAQHVLTAARNGHVDTATTLLSRLDLDTFEKTEVDSLLDVADELGNEAFTELLLESEVARSITDEAARLLAAEKAAASREYGRLLYAQQIENQCTIGVWDSRSGNSSELARIAKCPADIFASEDSQSLFVVNDTAIQVVSISESTDDVEVALPDLDYGAWIDQMTLRPDRNPQYLPSNTTMKPFGVGYLKDGSLGLLLRLWMPGDDEFHYLFKRDSNEQWSILEERWCGRWGCEDPIQALAFKSTDVWHWPESGMIWHPNLALNPYFVSQSVQMIDLEYEDYQGQAQKREFAIDGMSSTLAFYTSPSEHSDTNHTFGIELAANGNPPAVLSGNQCLTSIVGRYILVYEFFQGRFEVTDIGTGKVAFGNLKAARWLD